MDSVLQEINAKRDGHHKQLALLIDPDKYTNTDHLADTISLANESGVDLFFIGGSLMVTNHFEDCVAQVKASTDRPVVIFPGSPSQISSKADAILLLSLISGRNPEALIGQHVTAAPALKSSGLEILPTGYMLIDSGTPTSASYMSNTTPLPYDKPEIAACTAMAGEMLGLKVIYMDGGSGAKRTVSTAMITQVKKHTEAPLIVGGGIRDAETAHQICAAGADVIVVGNAAEKDPELIREIAHSIHSLVV